MSETPAELKPCPWCAGPAVITVFSESLEPDDSDPWPLHVHCSEDNNCAVRPDIYGRDEQDAIAKWNTRLSPQSPDGYVRGLRDAAEAITVRMEAMGTKLGERSRDWEVLNEARATIRAHIPATPANTWGNCRHGLPICHDCLIAGVEARVATPVADGEFNKGLEAAVKVITVKRDDLQRRMAGREIEIPWGEVEVCDELEQEIRALKTPSGEAHAATPADQGEQDTELG